MTMFRLDASIRTEGSHSRQIADIVQREWDATHPDHEVINREIGIDPLPSGAWAASLAQEPGAVELASTLVDELTAADAMLFAVPLYNFGVSQHFKTWVDLVVTDPRMAAGVTPATAGTPAVLATVHGGYYAAGRPREGCDHATPWMRRILRDVWQLDLLVVEADFTLVGTNPALDEFADLARGLRAAADGQAGEHGRTLASRVNRVPAVPARA